MDPILEAPARCAPDARTVVFELEGPTPYFVELIGNVQIAPVPRHVIEEHGRAWTRPADGRAT